MSALDVGEGEHGPVSNRALQSRSEINQTPQGKHPQHFKIHQMFLLELAQPRRPTGGFLAEVSRLVLTPADYCLGQQVHFLLHPGKMDQAGSVSNEVSG